MLPFIDIWLAQRNARPTGPSSVIAALPMTAWMQAGPSVQITGSDPTTTVKWLGKASAGTSGNWTMYNFGSIGTGISLGVLLNGKQTMRFTGQGGNLKTNDLATFVQASDIFGNGTNVANGSGWALINLASITGGSGTNGSSTDKNIFGCQSDIANLRVGTATNDQVVVGWRSNIFASRPIATTSWRFARWKCDGTTISVGSGLTSNGWSTNTGIANSINITDKVIVGGQTDSGAGSALMDAADIGFTKSALSDGAFDLIAAELATTFGISIT